MDYRPPGRPFGSPAKHSHSADQAVKRKNGVLVSLIPFRHPTTNQCFSTFLVSAWIQAVSQAYHAIKH